MNQIPSRIISIDIFRALTMLLMIFVNSLGYLDGIPEWLEHAKRNEDAMGLADIVFPCFLFIVGMSIPFAIKSRLKKGDSKSKIIIHVIIRTIALLIMGVFHENIYHINDEVCIMGWSTWQLLVNLCFILIWNIYPDKPNLKKLFTALRIFGLVSLLLLAIIFRGGEPDNLMFLKPRWWGILGIIGWTYLISSITYLYLKRNILYIILSFLLFATYNVLVHAQIITMSPTLQKSLSFLGSGSFVSLTLGGTIASLLFVWAKESNKLKQFFITIFSISVITFFVGAYTRQFWGISKLNETPAWVFFSLSASFFVFGLLFWLTDVKNYKKAFNIIKPAGTSTLLCYLIPLIYDSLIDLAGRSLPLFFNYGIVGLIKTALVAILIIMFTGKLEHLGIKMKL